MSHIAIALPLLAEWDNLQPLMQLLRSQQTTHETDLFVCVNQPDSWWNDGDAHLREACNDNQRTLQYLASHGSTAAGCPVHIIDRCSVGNGWSHKHSGVGWARKTLLDKIMQQCPDDTVIVSLDADTSFSPTYLASLQQFFATSGLQAVCVPYYHAVDDADIPGTRAMLRYEIYMRHYLVNLLRIHSPYAFCALGSAMAFTAGAYRHCGGMSPLQAGEDFYLLQRMVKTGVNVALWLPRSHEAVGSEVVLPQPRPSWRVPFGTGPAVARGLAAVEEQYPLYNPACFDMVGETYALFPELYDHDVQTPMTPFLQQQLRRDDLWGSLRKNFKKRELFVHACTELVDGLRILQYLHHTHNTAAPAPYTIDFHKAPIPEINNLRNQLYQQEMQLRLSSLTNNKLDEK
ncbi:MAG: hypothetical protein IJU81_09425 [Bacteroidales bacterium]|nr:hypothetical protein [Bacteroidales bacterium]